MNLLQCAALWLGGWVAIIAIYNIALLMAKNAPEWEQEFFIKLAPELVGDGNNLFSTGLIYMIGLVICKYVQIGFIHWGLMIIGIISCIPTILSIFITLITRLPAYRNKYMFLTLITAIIDDFVPLILAINIYFAYIQ